MTTDQQHATTTAAAQGADDQTTDTPVPDMSKTTCQVCRASVPWIELTRHLGIHNRY